jgi:hypothetical protein
MGVPTGTNGIIFGSPQIKYLVPKEPKKILVLLEYEKKTRFSYIEYSAGRTTGNKYLHSRICWLPILWQGG